MNTAYDAVTVAVFIALVILFLHRSLGEEVDPRPVWSYLIPAIGCAVANQLGNGGQALAAIAVLFGTLLYIALMLQPFGTAPR